MIGRCKAGTRGVKGLLMLQYYVKRFSTENYQSAKADSKPGRGPVLSLITAYRKLSVWKRSGKGPILAFIAVIGLANVLYWPVKA